MKKSAVLRLSLLLCACLSAAHAQETPQPGADRQGDMRPPLRALSSEERGEFREAHRQHRESWRQMSQEERHALRRDIREAGRSLYPRGPRRQSGD
ncbi:MAG: hypothetical protein AB1642_06335 [Pseudomonadota bacterium]